MKLTAKQIKNHSSEWNQYCLCHTLYNESIAKPT